MSKEHTLSIAHFLATTKLNPQAPGGLEAQKDAAVGMTKLIYDAVSSDVPERDRKGIWRTARKVLEERYAK